VAATLRVIRRHVMWRDWAIAYRVILDGEELGRVRDGQTVECKVTPGPHVLRIKLGWSGSRELRFGLRDRETAQFACRPSVQMFTTPMGMIARDRWVELEHVVSA
jgi:hypothetical protein